MLTYYKAKIAEVQTKTSEKCGQYIAVKFAVELNQTTTQTAYKSFFINHPKSEVAEKAKKMLYAMKMKKTQNAQADIIALNGADCFVALITTETVDQNFGTKTYTNVGNVYFII